MTTPFKSKQRGISFIGLLVIGGLVAAASVVAIQVVPTALEYQAVRKAANKAAEGVTVAEVRSLFDKAASIDNISSVTGRDIEVTKENDRVVVSFDYQREIHLAGPAFLTLKYSGRSK